MNLTEKEKGLLKDLRAQEALCVEKYGQYANSAADSELQALFSSIRETEQQHLQTVTKMLTDGGVTVGGAGPSEALCGDTCGCGTCSCLGDAYLCQDALSMEKHASSLYDTSIFEFNDGNTRQTLNKIQSDEQSHGKRLFDYMSAHGMQA